MMREWTVADRSLVSASYGNELGKGQAHSPISDKVREQLGCADCKLCKYPLGYGVPYCVPCYMTLEDYLNDRC